MPFRTAHMSRRRPLRLEPAADADAYLHGVRVLVVDDEWDNRQLLTALLVRAGAVVKTASSAAAALASLAAFKPDLVVSDIGMPDEDGYSLMRRMRALGPEAGGAAPAIALSGFVSNDVRRQALDAGFTSYLSKPVIAAEFLRAAQRLTGANATR